MAVNPRQVAFMSLERQAHYAATSTKNYINQNRSRPFRMRMDDPPYPWSVRQIGNAAYTLLHAPLSCQQRNELQGIFDRGIEWMMSH